MLTVREYRLKGPVSVLVKVGSNDMNCWTFQRQLLLSQSKFFSAALSGEWSESKTQTNELQEEEPSAFEVFVTWLCEGDLTFKDNGDKNVAFAEADTMAKAWSLVDKLDSDAFKDEVLETIISIHERVVITQQFIDLAFDFHFQVVSIMSCPIQHGLNGQHTCRL